MSQPTIKEFALLQTAVLLRRLAFEVNRAAKNGDHAAVHDVRVAIRRFSRCLRVFSQFYPGGSWKKIRRRLSALMTLAGVVRDIDLAMELLPGAGARGHRQLLSRLKQERRQGHRELLQE